MDKTNKALRKVQEEATTYRQKLANGVVRLSPEAESPQATKPRGSDEAQQKRQR